MYNYAGHDMYNSIELNPEPMGKNIWQVDVIMGLLACIGSFPCLCPVCLVVYKQHLTPKSFFILLQLEKRKKN